MKENRTIWTDFSVFSKTKQNLTLFLGTFQHFNCYERLLGSSLLVYDWYLGNLAKSTFPNDLPYRLMFPRGLPGACV